MQKSKADDTLLTLRHRLLHASTPIKRLCTLLTEYLVLSGLTLNDGVPWPVLAWTRFRLLGHTCAVKNTVTLAASDRLERCCVILPVKHEPFVVPQQLVLLLRLVDLFLVCK